MKKRTKVLAGAIAPAIALGGVAVVVEAPAQAAPGDYDGTGIAIRENSTLNSTVKGRGYAGQGLTSHCWKTGDWVTRGSFQSNYWHNNTNSTTGINGASSELYLNWSGGVAPC